ncbi:MAG: hypothetical protein HC898_00255 [Phycisphaerales bacterium]|nr:hypothetical protein [Phycisphaerales bacterium]
MLSTSALPEGMTIAWGDRLHLTFDAHKSENASPAQSSQLPTGRIGPLREALFAGNVRVTDPRLHLQADQLSATLASSRELSVKRNSPARLEKLTAQGNVRVQTQPSSQATRDQSADPSKVMDLEALTLNCDQLSVHMDESGKQSAQPRELLATGRVDAQTAEHRIQAGQMRVLLVPGKSAASAKETDQEQLQVESITARDNVTLQALALQATLTGTQVVIDTRKQQLTAVGDGNKPAHLRLPDATLTASQMVLDQARQKLTTPVSGVFIFLERDPRDPAAPPAVVTTQWSRDMSFDQAAGQVLFRGNVRTDSVARRDTMKLTCDELAVLFDPSSAQGDQVNASRDVRQVKTLAARHNVVFESVNWIDRPEGNPPPV